MAKSSKSEDKGTKTPTQDTIEKCKRDLCEEKVAASSEEQAKNTDVEAKEKVQKYKVCCLVKAQKTYHHYWNIDYCVATSAIEEADLVKTDIKSLVGKNGDLEKMLKDTVKAIKEVKTKLNEALDAACKFERCCEEEERCNPEILRALTDGIPGFISKVQHFKQHATNSYDKISKAFDSSVNISGIQTFSNIDSLTPFGDKLCELMGGLRKNLDENVKFSEGQVKESQTALTECIQDLTESKNERCKAKSTSGSAKKMYQFICEPDCPDDCHDHINCLCGDIPTFPPGTGTEECEDEKTPPQNIKDKGEWNM